ncbi:RNA-binding RNA processing protein rpp1 [Mitosporidium daphniae]
MLFRPQYSARGGQGRRCEQQQQAGKGVSTATWVVEAKLPTSPPLPSLPKWVFKVAAEQCALAGISPSSFKIYSRVTIQERSPAASNIDIIAVEPLNEKALLTACTTLDVDVIKLKMEERLPFPLKPSIVGAAILRGIFFEISLQDAIVFGESAPSKLRNFLANAASLISASKGRNLLFTSGASEKFGVRSPHDSSNILHLLGMKSASDALFSLKENPIKVLKHAAMRRMTFRNVVGVKPDPSFSEPVSSALDSDFLSFAETEALNY